MEAKAGSRVKVIYTGKLKDGNVFDTNQMGELLEFTVGDGELLPGFENTLVGMTVGEKRVVTIPAGEAYGERDEGMIGDVPRDALPEGAKVEPGEVVTMVDGDQQAEVTIVKVDGDTVTVDGNHTLAGEELTFEIELVEVAA